MKPKTAPMMPILNPQHPKIEGDEVDFGAGKGDFAPWLQKNNFFAPKPLTLGRK